MICCSSINRVINNMHLGQIKLYDSSIPYHAHPSLKRWLNDYSVEEIAEGFRTMDGLCRVGGVGGITQKAAFERVFGSRCVLFSR